MMTKEEYVEALKNHDWEYERSDDHDYYLRIRAERLDLLRNAVEHDSNFEIWNEVAPEAYRMRSQK